MGGVPSTSSLLCATNDAGTKEGIVPVSFICTPQFNTSVHGLVQLDSLDDAMCDMLLGLRQNIEPVSAKVGKQGGGHDVVSTIRDVMAYPITGPEPDKILHHIATEANNSFNYELTGLLESSALLRYTAPSNGYDWHVDVSEDIESLRKISIIINLNDGYEGGDFEMFSQGKTAIKLGRGDVIAFSPFLPHRITPVTEGERWSLVAWVSGPCFR